MDFTFDEAQQAAHDLAKKILADKLTMERLMEIEASGEWFAAAEWAALGKAGLLGVALPEDVGGGGLDEIAWAAVLQAQGATVAPLPLLESSLAGLAIDRFGTAEQRSTWLPGIADGSTIVTVAIQEPFDDRLTAPSCTVTGGAMSGSKAVVEWADRAARILVTATTSDGPGLFLVDPLGAGVTSTPGLSTRTQPLAFLDFDGSPAEPVGEAGSGSVGWLVDRAIIGLCAIQTGVTDRALRLTAEYATTREQFGRPIATFQAVTQRLADQYINVEGIRLCTAAAVYKLAHGEPATEDVHIAKFWASQRASDVAHATQHCHGGMGVSVDYPLHRYTLWNKHIATSLGAGNQHLRAIGAGLAAS